MQIIYTILQAFPKWMESSEFQVNTPSTEFNQVITVLLKTSMFLAGAIGCFLDNTIPGKHKFYFMLDSRYIKLL